MLEQYNLPNDKGGLESTCEGTCIHILTAALEHVSVWRRSYQAPEGNKLKDQKKDGPRDETTPMWSSDELDQAEEEWDWETPVLSEGSLW
jgi:hypothetical protein